MRLMGKMCSGLALCLVLMIPTRAHAGFTEVCAGSPSDAVEVWAQAFPNNPADDADERADCEKLCKVWRTTCKNIANVSAKCLRGFVANTLKLIAAECRLQPDPLTKEECKLQVALIRDSFKEELRFDVALSHEFCEARVEDCILACLNDDPT